MNKIKMDKKSIAKFSLLVLFALTMGILALKYGPWISENIKDPEKVRAYLLAFGNMGALVYVLIQAVHVLVVVIPGDLFNICGGYIYGIPLGFVLSYGGLMIGTVCAFYISRILGYDFISKFVAQEKINKISTVINSSKGMIGMLIICLIPVIPKDLMMYVAGLTPIKASKLFIVYGLSRIPGTMIWVSVGANIYEQNVFGIMITIIGLVVLIAAGFILQHQTRHQTEETL